MTHCYDLFLLAVFVGYVAGMALGRWFVSVRRRRR